MKIRNGFVSNSSSSSFIINNNIEKAKEILEQNRKDYIILNNVLFTEFISDAEDYYNQLYDLSNDQLDYIPYDEDDDFWIFEGVRGTDIYLKKHYCQHLTELENIIKDKVYNLVKQQVKNGNITIDNQTVEKIKGILQYEPN